MVTGTGLTTVLSQSLGSKREDRINEMINSSLLVNLTFGLVMGGALHLFAEPILRMMGLAGDVLHLGTRYLKLLALFSFLLSLSVVYSSVLRGFKKTRVTLMIMVVVNLVNLCGSWIAVYPPFGLPQTGVDGVAVAAIISQITGLVLQYGYVSHKLGISFILSRKLFKSPEIREIFRIGGPSAVEILASHSAQLTLTSMASMMSAEALITRAYLQNIMMFIMMVAMAVGQSTQIMTAHLVGAGRRIEAYERSRKNATYTLAVVVVMTSLVALNGQRILGFYTMTSSVIQLGRTLLFITMILECGRALNIVAAQTMKGMGEARYPAIVGIVVGWGVGVLFSYILGIRLEIGLIGVWLAMATDEWARALLLWRCLHAKN